MGKITVKQLEALRPGDAGKKLREDGGLIGVIRLRTEGVSVKWDWRYRFGGKVRQIAVGTWPRESIADIRRERDRLAGILNSGKDPADEKRAVRLQSRADQLEAVAKEQARLSVVAAQQARMTVLQLFGRWERLELIERKDGGKEAKRSFEKDVLPKIGSMAAEDVKRPHIAEILDAVVERGSRIGARNLLGDIRQMFGFAIKRGWLDNDPTSHMKRDDYGRKKERERVLSEAEIKMLVEALPKARMGRTSELAIWLQLATCCRIGELYQARWADIDFEGRTWRIPADIAKNEKEHTVYLSDFALAKFESLKSITGTVKDESGSEVSGVWAFPARYTNSHVCVKTLTKQIGDRQRGERGAMSCRTPNVDALILSGGKWTPHDLRRTGATMMVALGVLPEVVERCLNHVEQNRVKRIYQRHDYRAEMKEAWRLLGERLELLTRGADNVVPLRGMAA